MADPTPTDEQREAAREWLKYQGRMRSGSKYLGIDVDSLGRILAKREQAAREAGIEEAARWHEERAALAETSRAEATTADLRATWGAIANTHLICAEEHRALKVKP